LPCWSALDVARAKPNAELVTWLHGDPTSPVGLKAAADFWRVEEAEPERLLRLRAEMRLTVYTQRAPFHPHGLLGHLYSWVISPFHWVVFGGMKRNIARAAETEA
jgi:hypothetical protein